MVANVLLIDEHNSTPWSAVRLSHRCRLGILFPYVYGRIHRDAVQGMIEIQGDAVGRAMELAVWS
jgi:hypothetical protein